MCNPSTKVSFFSLLLGACFVVGAAITPAHAQATRTWVSGVGDDVNPCSRTAPCKTWAGAISKTAAGGEIDNLDTGGFGALTITKSITIDGGGGEVASSLVTGTNGMTISAATTDVVILRNLEFQGILQSGNAGLSGVQINQAARVVLDHDAIYGFGNGTGTGGIVITPSANVNVNIQNTSVFNNLVGMYDKPTGGATVNLTVEHSYFDNNLGAGIRIDGTGGGNSNVAITDTSISLNAANGLTAVSGSSGNTYVDLTRDVIADNTQNGVDANASGGGASTVTVGSSILSRNVVGAWNNPGSAAMLLSFGNNQVTGPTGSTPSNASFQ
jgi:hypothetical protein